MFRECSNCEYGRGIGSDVWCGHNPKGKETYMATRDTDCVYYKADKWTQDESVLERGMRLAPYASSIKDEDTEVTINSFVSEDSYDLLKNLEEQNEHLKKSIKRQQGSNNECSKLVFDLNDKNQRLKKALKKIKKENRELKHEVHFYKSFQKDARDLEKENRQLKQEIFYKKDVRELEKENEQLTNVIKTMSANKKLENENEQLKQVLGSILLSVKREISASHKTGEIRTFINPNSYDLISDVLRKYGGLKGWYDD